MLRAVKLLLTIVTLSVLTGCGDSVANIEAKPSSFSVSHNDLVKAILANKVVAKETYGGKVITVEGHISYIGQSRDDEHPYLLAMSYTKIKEKYGDKYDFGVGIGVLHFSEKQKDSLRRLKKNDFVRVKGLVEVQENAYEMTGCVLQ